MKYNNNRAIFEIEMIHLCKPEMDTDYAALYQRIAKLEEIIYQQSNNQITDSIESSINESEFITLKFKPQYNIYTEVFYG